MGLMISSTSYRIIEQSHSIYDAGPVIVVYAYMKWCAYI